MTHPLRRCPPRATLRIAAAAVVLAGALGAARAVPLDDIRRQVEASQFDQAYATAQANPQLIGDVHFDFPYGVAAINVGKVAEGLLALERHLAAVPANDRARLELARGYFLLGEYARARSEFEFVLRYNPPPGVRANIIGFLQAMQVRDAADGRATARVYAEVGFGHDNNVNGGTFHDVANLSGGIADLPGTDSFKVRDTFGQFTAGGQRLVRVSNRVAVFVGADLDVRGNFHADKYDLTTAGAYVGFTQLSGPALWRFSLGSSDMQVGGNRYRDTLQLNGEATFTLGPALSLTGFAQLAEWRHAQENENHDERASTAGAMATWAFTEMAAAPVFGVRLSFTQEDNTRFRPDFSRQTPLLRLFASASASDRVRLSAGLTAYHQKYESADFVTYDYARSDNTLAVDLSASYAFDTNWSLRADAGWMQTRSNQDLYDNRRAYGSVKLRYQY